MPQGHLIFSYPKSQPITVHETKQNKKITRQNPQQQIKSFTKSKFAIFSGSWLFLEADTLGLIF